ncbi:DUF885 family protein [Sphingorhabdus sp.]|uniref:DUF885 family protein n=1 Tax=Sphingorhabdus sp. TaxID=1902408 RepID=UPI004053C122
MRITKTAISGLAIALAYVASPAIAQTTATAPTAAAKVDQSAAITAFFEEYDAQQLALSPLSKSYRGIKDSDYGRWGDFTNAAEARANDAVRSALKEMRARFDPAQLTPENRLSYRLFEKARRTQ